MTPDKLPADMEAVVSEWLDMAQRVEPSTISTIRGVPVCQTEIDYIRALLKAYQEQRRALAEILKTAKTLRIATSALVLAGKSEAAEMVTSVADGFEAIARAALNQKGDER